MVLTFPDFKRDCMSAVELVGSRRPVGKRWETRSVFHGLSIGNRACAVRREPAQPAVHKSTVQSAFHLSGRSRELFGRTSEIGLVRRLPVERLMRSPPVVSDCPKNWNRRNLPAYAHEDQFDVFVCIDPL